MKRSKEFIEIISFGKITFILNQIMNEINLNGYFQYAIIKNQDKFPQLFMDIKTLKSLSGADIIIGSKIRMDISGSKFKLKGSGDAFNIREVDLFREIIDTIAKLDHGKVFIKIERVYHQNLNEKGYTRGIGWKLIAKTDNAEIRNILKFHLGQRENKTGHSFFYNYPILAKDSLVSLIPKNYKNFNYGNIPIGFANKSGRIKIDDDENPHTLLVGATGSGKSTIVLRIIEYLSKKDDWKVIIIDPHGETSNKLMKILDNIYEISPYEGNGINLLSRPPNGDVYRLAEDITTIIKSLREAQYNEQFFGPRMEDIIVRGIVELSKDEGSTLYDLYKLLRKKPSYLDENIKNSEFMDQINKLSDEELSSSIRAIGRLVLNPMLRNLICAKSEESILRLSGDRIISINMDRAVLGYENSRILSNLFLVKLWQEIQSANIDKKILLILEESQDYLSNILFDITSAGRKFGLRVFLVTTSLLSLEEKLRNKLFSNIGNMIFMKLSTWDNQFLKREIGMEIPIESNLHFYYVVNKNGITGEINPVAVESPVRKPLTINNNIDDEEEIKEKIASILNQMDSYREILFIIPEFYLYLNSEKSLVLKFLKDELGKRGNISYVKRVDVDFKGIKGRYQCFRLSPQNPGKGGLDKFFVEFSNYLEGKFRNIEKSNPDVNNITSSQ